jgi:hypothetical protein
MRKRVLLNIQFSDDNHLSLDVVEQDIKLEKNKMNVVRKLDIHQAIKDKDKKLGLVEDLLNYSYDKLKDQVKDLTKEASAALLPDYIPLLEKAQNQIFSSHQLKPIFNPPKLLHYDPEVVVLKDKFDVLELVHSGENSDVWKVMIRNKVAILKVSNAVGNDFYEHYLYWYILSLSLYFVCGTHLFS